MCAGSNTIIKNEEVNVYMGYYGGRLSIGNINYKDNNVKERPVMAAKLKSFKKDDLIEMILNLIDNADE